MQIIFMLATNYVYFIIIRISLLFLSYFLRVINKSAILPFIKFSIYLISNFGCEQQSRFHKSKFSAEKKFYTKLFEIIKFYEFFFI